MTQSHSRRPSSGRASAPLDQPGLEALALRYVERFQTTRARLVRHLAAKLRQRGWKEPVLPDLDALANRLAACGYINEDAFADARTRGMKARGLGMQRILDQLRADGVALEAELHDAGEALQLARKFAKRRRLGPFGPPVTDPRVRARQMAAMLRAGHAAEVARRVLLGSPEDAGDERPGNADNG
ncbi:regulatory protein RecX [Thermaurantiacus sp.]